MRLESADHVGEGKAGRRLKFTARSWRYSDPVVVWCPVK